MKPLYLPRIQALDLRRQRDRPLYVSLDVGADGEANLAVWVGGEVREVIPLPGTLATLGPERIAEEINLRSQCVVATLPVPLDVVAVRPPGVWPWLVDKLLDAVFPIRWRAHQWARAHIERHGIRCRCGLPIDRRDAAAARDGYVCVGCRRFNSGLHIAAARGRPVRTVLFGL